MKNKMPKITQNRNVKMVRMLKPLVLDIPRSLSGFHLNINQIFLSELTLEVSCL